MLTTISYSLRECWKQVALQLKGKKPQLVYPPRFVMQIGVATRKLVVGFM